VSFLTRPVNPLKELSVKGFYRYYSTDNSTEYTACNPLTSQWGRLINDGSGGAFVSNAAYLAAKCDLAAVEALNQVPSAGNVNIRSVPFAYDRMNYGLQADWRISTKSNGTLLLEREDYKPDNRERDKTWEDRIKVGYTNRALADVTLLASYEYDRRRGSEYIVDPYEHFLRRRWPVAERRRNQPGVLVPQHRFVAEVRSRRSRPEHRQRA
jgi:hypothetical protein